MVSDGLGTSVYAHCIASTAKRGVIEHRIGIMSCLISSEDMNKIVERGVLHNGVGNIMLEFESLRGPRENRNDDENERNPRLHFGEPLNVFVVFFLP